VPRRILLLALLTAALAACSTAPPSSSPSVAPSVPSSADADVVDLNVADFMLGDSDIEVTGPTVRLAVTNDGPTPHNVAIRTLDGDVVASTADLSTGESETISVDLEPGDYVTFCSLAGHESLGIRGTLTVRAS
jgi:uncharacterized cupredoxin-like copper-binding protein